MKIYILGTGHRLSELADAFATRREDVFSLTNDPSTWKQLSDKKYPVKIADPATVTLTEIGVAPQLDDIILLCDWEEPRLRAILANIARQNLPATVLVFTPESARALAREFPQFLFKSHKTIYRTEMRDLFRRSATLKRVNQMRRIVKERGRVLILIWGNPDPDAIASSWALQELLAGDAAEIKIAYTGEFTRQENLAMMNTLRIPLAKFQESLLAGHPLVATVDAQPSFFQMNGRLGFDIIIDHHPLTDLGQHRYADVRPGYGSTSTIMTEYYQDTRKKLSRRLATALYYGLKIDTGNLTRNVSDSDVDAFRYLRARIDENIVRTIELSQLPLTTLDYFSIAISNKKVARDVAFSYIGHVTNPDMGVHVADFFIKISGISWVVVACRTNEKVVVVFRTDGLRRHAGRIAEALFIDYGTAGGHRTMARAELLLEKLKAEVPELTDIAVERWLLSRLSLKLKALSAYAGA